MLKFLIIMWAIGSIVWLWTFGLNLLERNRRR